MTCSRASVFVAEQGWARAPPRGSNRKGSHGDCARPGERPRGGWAGRARARLGQGRQRGCGSCFGPEAVAVGRAVVTCTRSFSGIFPGDLTAPASIGPQHGRRVCQNTRHKLFFSLVLQFPISVRCMSVRMCVCALCVQSLWRPEGGDGSPAIVVPEGCEPPCRCQEPLWSSARAAGALTC